MFTPRDGGQIQNFFENEYGRARFPNADTFNFVEEAQNECDRWRLVLRSRYNVPIRQYSGGYVNDHFDESKDSLELTDFLTRNQEVLETYREAHKPDKTLDYFAEHGTIEQKGWALAVKVKQAEFDNFCKSHDYQTLKRKSDSAQRYLKLLESPLRELAEATDTPIVKALCGSIQESGLTLTVRCGKLIAEYETLLRELDNLKNNRP